MLTFAQKVCLSSVVEGMLNEAQPTRFQFLPVSEELERMNLMVFVRSALVSAFTKEAATLLLKLPNPFYFWFVMEEALHRVNAEGELFGADHVREALQDMRNEVAETFDLTMPISGVEDIEDKRMRHSIIAERTAAGLCLYIPQGYREGQGRIIDNPIYFDKEFFPQE